MAFSLRNFFGAPSKQEQDSISSAVNTAEGSDRPNFVFKDSGLPMNDSNPPDHPASNPQARIPSELLLFGDVMDQIPTDLLRANQTPASQPLQISPEVLDEHLSHGATSLPLFEIYRVCPAAFQSPVAPQDPRIVSIPPTKLVGLIGLLQKHKSQTSPAPKTNAPLDFKSLSAQPKPEQKSTVVSSFSHLPKPIRSENNSFNLLPRKKNSIHSPSEAGASASSADSEATDTLPKKSISSPFVPAPSSSPSSPFSIVSRPKASQPASEESPKPAEAPPLATASPFQLVRPTTEAAAQDSLLSDAPEVSPPQEKIDSPFILPSSLAKEPERCESEPEITVGLASLLSKVPPHLLGIDYHQIPEKAQVAIPYSALKDQLHQGSQRLSVGQLQRFLSSEYQNLLKDANSELQVELPANSIYHLLSDPSSSSDKFTKLDFASEKNSEPVPPSLHGLEAFPQLPADFVTSDLPEEMPGLDFLPSPELSELDRENGKARLAAAELQPSARISDPMDELPTPPKVAEPAPSFSEPRPATPPQSQHATSPPMFATATPSAGTLEFKEVPTPKQKSDQLIWRVLLGAKQDLDLEGILKLTRENLGLVAIAAMKNGQLISSNSEDIHEAKAYLAQAPLICEHLQPLIQLTGIQDTETFSIKNHQYVQTFSAQPNYTLAVMYLPPEDETSLKEKLTLIARELSRFIS